MWLRRQAGRISVLMLVAAWLTPAAAQTPDALVARIKGYELRRAPVELVLTHLEDESSQVRRAAALAVGRIGDHRAARSLSRLLVDPDDTTRHRAIFAMGLLAHGKCWPFLRAVLRSADAGDRATAAWSAGLICQLADADALSDAQRDEIVSRLAPLLDDGDAEVRRKAAIALGFSKRPQAIEPLAAHLDQHTPAPLRWRLIYAIGRIGGERAVGVLRRAAADPRPTRWSREFAAMYLARNGSAAAAAPLRALLADRNPLVAANAARGLGKHPGAETEGALGAALRDHAAWQVRWEAAKALGRLRAESEVARLERAQAADVSPSVRSAAAAALVSIEPDRIEGMLETPDAPELPAAAGALAARASAASGGELKTLMALVTSTLAKAPVTAQAELIGELSPKGPGAVEALLLASLGSSELAIRGNAAYVLKSYMTGLGKAAEASKKAASEAKQAAEAAQGDAKAEAQRAADDAAKDAEAKAKLAAAAGERLLSPVTAALKASQAAAFGEVRELLAELLGATGNAEGATAPLQACLEDELAAVREAAAKALSKLSGKTVEARPGKPAALPAWDTPIVDRPEIELLTTKGRIRLVLFPQAAPLHARKILELVASGFYAGKTWHRVVSAFVIQGGAPRADGWGDPGFSLPDEINPRPYVEGTLGMPKAGKDTGSCQLFITHLPTPHLDGRYTVFGQVVDGLATVDRIEQGDRIISARRIK